MLGFIGGTGPEGRGLALRFALAGEKILIGSRSEERANQAAESVSELAPPGSVRGAMNSEVAQEADIVFIAVPYSAQRDTLNDLKEQLSGKLVINLIAPIEFNKGRASAIIVEEGSAALESQAILAESTIVAAFQNVSAEDLLVPEKSIDSDVIVCADDAEAKERVMKMVEMIKGARAVNGGGLVNARYVENLTALLVTINRICKAHSSIKITGI